MPQSSPALPVAVSGVDALTVATRCVQEGGRIARDNFERPLSVGVKGRGNLVTQVDIEIEAAVARILAEEYPGHALLSEERGLTGSGDWGWILDPIDGTRNFVSRIPFFCVNVALCYREEPLVAATFDPNHGDLFTAVSGQGTRLNGERVHASGKTTLHAGVLGVDMGYDDARGALILDLVRALWPGMQSLRIPGSAALGIAYSSCGRFDLFVHNYVFPWDLAAGILLVREAGGKITGRDGAAVTIHSEGIVAGGPQVHADFLRLAAGLPWRMPAAGREEVS